MIDLCITIMKPFKHVKVLLQWYKNILWYDYDFDAHSLYGIINYKLSRVYACLSADKHVEYSKAEMHALRLAIKLSHRLNEDKYGERLHERHSKKWGELKVWFTPCEDRSNYHKWNSSRPQAYNEKLQKQEREEMLKVYDTIQYLRQRESRNLYAILHIYLNRWWS